jgi:hypothetical protein
MPLVAFLISNEGYSREQIGRLMATLRRFHGQFRPDVPDDIKRKDERAPAA